MARGLLRPVWGDDPHFNIRYHVRQSALPAPGGEQELRALAGRVFSQQLDRSKPLWELWLIEGLADGRFALVTKTHHALVDGISSVDIASVLFDTTRRAKARADHQDWAPRPLPSSARRVLDGGVDYAREALDLAAAAECLARGRREALDRLRETLAAVGASALAGLEAAPATPYNGRISPHRRVAWVRAPLDDVRAIKAAAGTTLNDVVLAVVAGALRRHLEQRRVDVRGLELRVLVPVSTRADPERGALGNRVSGITAPLPVGIADPLPRLTRVASEMRGLKESGQAIGADVLIRLGTFTPPTIMAQASRIAPTSRVVNLVVTNVPGPQVPLYLRGREMLEALPFVPLAAGLGLGITVVSYHGQLVFGLCGDWDLLEDIDDLQAAFEAELAAIGDAALAQPQPAIGGADGQ